MSSRFLILALSSVLLFSASACRSHGKKAAKVTKTPAAELEAEYHTLFVNKRTNELVATGLAQADAMAKAEAEYAETYKYAINNKKK